MDFNGYTKDLGTICQDMSSVFILDNSPAAYRGNPGRYVCVCASLCNPHIWGRGYYQGNTKRST